MKLQHIARVLWAIALGFSLTYVVAATLVIVGTIADKYGFLWAYVPIWAVIASWAWLWNPTKEGKE